MPDYGWGRCDGHHEMVDLAETVSIRNTGTAGSVASAAPAIPIPNGNGTGTPAARDARQRWGFYFAPISDVLPLVRLLICADTQWGRWAEPPICQFSGGIFSNQK